VWTEVWTNLWTVSPHQNPPPPPLHKGFGGGPEPDYPPSTCYVRVVWLGFCYSDCSRGGGGTAGASAWRAGCSQRVGLGVKVKVKVKVRINGNGG
jgi:hypothetical protein